LELHIEYKIVIEYGTKYKCTDFIATGILFVSDSLFGVVVCG
jgi:hypothetical protein